MLFKLPSTPKSNPTVSGRSLAHSKASVSQRALLVADVLAGKVNFKPTIGRLASEARVSVSSVRAARQIVDDPNARFDALSGSCGLQTAAARHKKAHKNGNGNGMKPMQTMSPADWNWADTAERQQFISSLGIASVFDVIDQLTR